MGSGMRWAGKCAIVATALVACLPEGMAAGRQVHIRKSRTGYYTASATYVPFAGSAAVSRLANRLLRAEADKGVRDFVRQANRDLRLQGRLRLPYEHTAAGTTCLSRADLASAYLTTDEFTGGAHGMTFYTTVNVGIVNGRARRLGLQDLFRRGVPGADVAAQRVREVLRANPRAAWLAPDADPETRPTDADLIRSFVITPAGLTFLIGPYVAGPYSAGAFTVKVPFADLGGRLDANGPLRGLISRREGRSSIPRVVAREFAQGLAANQQSGSTVTMGMGSGRPPQRWR